MWFDMEFNDYGEENSRVDGVPQNIVRVFCRTYATIVRLQDGNETLTVSLDALATSTGYSTKGLALILNDLASFGLIRCKAGATERDPWTISIVDR
jgi:hypothetical protein